MVEQIEELSSDANFCAFPVRDFEVLHHREIRVEVLRSIKLVPALGSKVCSSGREHSCCQAWRLHRAGTTGGRSPALVIGKDESANTAEVSPVIKCGKISRLGAVYHGKWQTAAR